MIQVSSFHGDGGLTLSKLVFKKCCFLFSLSSRGQNSSLSSFLRSTSSMSRPVWWILDSAGSISAKNSSSRAYVTFLDVEVPLKISLVGCRSSCLSDSGTSVATIVRKT